MRFPGKPLLLALVAVAAGLGALGGCSKPASRAEEPIPQASSSRSREAEKTRELEEKAAANEERFREIQESDMSAEQKAQAVGDLVDEQQRTVREAEDGSAGDSGDESQ